MKGAISFLSSSTWCAPVACALLVACSGKPPVQSKEEVLASARTALRAGPEFAVSMIERAPAEVLADPEVQELLQIAKRQANMTPEARKQDDFNRATDKYLVRLSELSPGDVQTVEGVADAASLFSNASLILGDDALAGLDERSKAKAAKLRTLLVARQKAIFPAMRKTYAAAMGADVGVVAAGVDMSASGPGAKTLRVASSAFYSADTIQRAHEALMMRATRLRFARADYQPYMGGPITSYKLNGRADEDVSY